MHDSLERTDGRDDRRLRTHELPGAADGDVQPQAGGGDRNQATVATLAATAASRTAERDALEDRIAELEATVETLESKLEAKDRQQQQIVDTYERILSRHDVDTPDFDVASEQAATTERDDGHHSSPQEHSRGDQRRLPGSSLLDALVSSDSR